MNFRKMSCITAVIVLLSVSFVGSAFAQIRERVVKTTSSQPVNQPPASSPSISKPKTFSSSLPVNPPAARPALTSEIEIAPPLVKKTGSSSPVDMTNAVIGKAVYSSSVSRSMLDSINSKLGIPYRYGSSGPKSYDCSGFVWSVFKEAGLNFERTSARTLWNTSAPVTGDERLKFGTLVFFNDLGHMGIVADAEGFYHASVSKGITYSKFAGYWEKRIVGFRRLAAVVPPSATTQTK